MQRENIKTNDAPAAIGPYSQAVRIGEFVYLSGQLPMDTQSGEIVGGGIEAQAREVLKNMLAILKASGLGYANVVKTTIFLTDLGDFQKVNEVYAECFGDILPARSTIQVSALPKGAAIEIEAIAVK